MTITGIDALTFGVADLDEAHRFAADWGLLRDPDDGSRYTTTDGSEIFVRAASDTDLPAAIETGSTLREVVWGVDSEAALADIDRRLRVHGQPVHRDGTAVCSVDPFGLAISFRVSRRTPGGVVPYHQNGPGAPGRIDARAPFYIRATPHEISHIVLGVGDLAALEAFYANVLGFIVSDRYRARAVFLRASPQGNHHHLFGLNAADGATRFNHVCFKVRDIHEVIGGGQYIVSKGWTSQAGPGRHYVSSACFWYFRSPFGGAFEYAADEDVVSETWVAGEYEMSPEIFTEWKFNLGDAATSMPIAASRPV
jgi:Glyoxalase/Bleomycin resistance protein/Dioxygenase superfamily